MRHKSVLLIPIFSFAFLFAQEKLSLDANSARQQLAERVVRGSIGVGTMGVVDGPPPAPLPLKLTVQSLKTNASGASSTRQLDYEFRLTNISASTMAIPVDPDLDKLFHACGSGTVQQAGVSVEFRGVTSQEQFLPGSAVWFGCPKVGGSIVNLAPGEWITYRGSTVVPQNLGPPGTVTAGWSISDVRYSVAPGGLTQDSTSRLVIISEARQIN